MVVRVFGFVVVLLIGVLAGPVAAAASEQPQVTDRCGDAGRMVELANRRLVDNPDEERVAGFDIKSVSFRDLVGGGVQIELELCGDVPDVELQGANWAVGWRLTDRCGASVGVNDVLSSADPGTVERVGTFSSTCSRPSDLPPGDWWESYYRYHHELTSGVEITGNRITWTLPRGAFAGDAAADLTSGTVWTALSAETHDSRRGTSAWAGDGEDAYTYYVAGPGAADYTTRAAAGEFVVGD